MMHATYWKDDDILEVRFSDKPKLVAVVFLDAVKEGYFTPEANGRKAA